MHYLYSLLIPGLLLAFPLSIMGQQKVPGHFDPVTETYFPSNPNYRVSKFVHGIALVQKKGRFGFINTDGRVVKKFKKSFVPLQFDKANPIGIVMFDPPSPRKPINAFCSGSHGGTYFLCNESGQLLVESKMVWKPGTGPRSMVQENGLIVSLSFDPTLKDGECEMCQKCYGTTAVLNSAGEQLVGLGKYSSIFPFFNDRAPVTNQDNKKGFIDGNGKEVIPCEYDWVGSFKEGYAWVKKGGEKFKIDPDGKRLPD